MTLAVLRRTRWRVLLAGLTRRRADVVRHPGDVLRLGAGLATLVVTGMLARAGQPSRFEVDVFGLVNNLPDAVERPMWAMMQAGSLAAVPVTAAAAVLARRSRLARDLAVSGLLAWCLAKVVKDLVDRGRPGHLLAGVLRGAHDTGLGFPSGHTAVAAALATAAAPYLPVRARRAVWVLVALAGVARIHVGAHLPLDVVGGAALGWAVGASVHLLLGAPGGLPDLDTVRAALTRVGLPATVVEPLSADARGSAPFLAVVGGQRLFVKAVSRTQRDADALFRLWRLLVLRRSGDGPPFASVKQQVEHEAYLCLLAARAGVRVPDVVATTPSVASTVLLVQQYVPGRAVDTLPADALDDKLLNDLWRQVSLLHRARIAHRDLRLANVLVDDCRQPWLVDFGFAEAGAEDGHLDADVAELLTGLATVVGPERAVHSSLTALEPAELTRCLPLLQAPALSAATRSTLRGHRELLPRLRATVASTTETVVPALPALTRARWRTLLLLFGLGFAVHALLPQLDETGRALGQLATADPRWVLAAVAGSTLTYAFAAVSLLAATPRRLSYARTVAVQLASSFTNRLAPAGFGGLALNLRYLRRSGLGNVEAATVVAVNAAAGVMVHVTCLVAALGLLTRTGVGDVRLPPHWLVLAIVVAGLAVAGAAVFAPQIRRRGLSALQQPTAHLLAVLHRPSRAAWLILGAGGVTTAYTLTMAASLHAFTGDVPLMRVAAVYLAGMAAASVSPTPSGLGAVEAALTAGLTVMGIPFPQALAGVLTFRLITYWLPIPPGLVAYRILLRLQAV
jgi:undecaprenyl-diphosphatase